MNNNNTEITELEVVNFLTKRKDSLLKEINSINDIISSITQKDSVSTKKKQDNFNHIKDSRKKRIDIPDAYSPELKIDEKILYAVKKLKKPNREEIIAYLLKEDPLLDQNKTSRNIITRLSILRKENYLTAKKDGRRYRYTIANS